MQVLQEFNEIKMTSAAMVFMTYELSHLIGFEKLIFRKP
jgi:hypothetical protein